MGSFGEKSGGPEGPPLILTPDFCLLTTCLVTVVIRLVRTIHRHA